MKHCLRKFLAIVMLASGIASADPSGDHFLPLADGLVPLDSDAGKSLLNGGSSAAFWKLIQFYSIQPNLSTCGVASCTMVLNSLPVARPLSATHGEFRLHTADNFFSPAVTAIVPREKVYKSGMSLVQLGEVLATFPVETTTVPASTTTVEAFRKELENCTKEAGRMMLVNYLRKSLGQESGGHISPIGAYHAGQDKVLILDVSTYKYPWVWVETNRLFEAMGGNGKTEVTRGYVVVSPRTE